MTAECGITGPVLHVGTRALATRHGEFAVHLCHDLMRRTHLLAIALGDLASAEPLLARVHSSCVTSETYGGCDCECSEQLESHRAVVAPQGDHKAHPSVFGGGGVPRQRADTLERAGLVLVQHGKDLFLIGEPFILRDPAVAS